MKICFLDKEETSVWLPRMFDLLYENMKDIAPSSLPFEQEQARFLTEVGAALEKGPRQVLLAVYDGALVGYIQYYTRGELLMVEEFQLRQDHQKTLLFLGLCRGLLRHLPRGIMTVEAYADPRNEKSRRLMAKLGMVELADFGEFVHLRGDAVAIRKRFMGILPLETE